MPRLPLNPAQIQARIFGLLILIGFLILARFINPRHGSEFILSGFRRITGLPCPLCGGTRATHYLLQGNLEQTLYYNWLAIPSLLVALILIICWTAEIITRRILLPHFKVPVKVWFLALPLLLLVWGIQIHSALNHPKPELLNARGLYFKFNSGSIPPQPLTPTPEEPQ
ncbi:MAG: DUF2752 domain-containing protein [Blastochloris sp.]|nr:DUF2752 domain-containing protein [Blastochloris sp.]